MHWSRTLLILGVASIASPAQTEWRSEPLAPPAVVHERPDGDARRIRRWVDVVANGALLAWLVVDTDAAPHVPRSTVRVYLQRPGRAARLIGVVPRVRGARPKVALDRHGAVFLETRGRVHVFSASREPRVIVPPVGTRLLRYDATSILVAEPGRPPSLALYRLDAADRPIDRRPIAKGRAALWRHRRRTSFVDGRYWFAGGRHAAIVAIDKRTGARRQLGATGEIDVVSRDWLFVRDDDVARLVHVTRGETHALLAPARIRHVGPHGILHDGPAGARWWDPVDGRRADVALSRNTRIVGWSRSGLIVSGRDGVKRLPVPVERRPVSTAARAVGRAARDRLAAVHAASVASGRWETGAALYDVAWPLAPGTGDVLLAIARDDPDPNTRRRAARLAGWFDVTGAADALLSLGGALASDGLAHVATPAHVDRLIRDAKGRAALAAAVRCAAIHGTSFDVATLRERGASAERCALVAARRGFIRALRSQRAR